MRDSRDSDDAQALYDSLRVFDLSDEEIAELMESDCSICGADAVYYAAGSQEGTSWFFYRTCQDCQVIGVTLNPDQAH